MRSILAVAAVCLLLPEHSHADGHGGHSACSYDHWDWNACRQGIVDVANDRSMFYFGSQRPECMNAAPMDIDCWNNFGTFNNSIASILGIEASTIDRYLNVTFHSDKGHYEHCDTKYVQEKSRHIVLDPISGEVHKPWDVRGIPDITWNADPNMYYTLVVKDVGFGFTHGLWINIKGNDTTTADIIDQYHGPQNFRNVTNPYIFLLFGQNGMITLPEDWRMAVVSGQPIDIPEAQAALQLTGPLAMNWIASVNDPYSLSLMTLWVENCASFVQQTLHTHEISFLPSIPKLSVYMRVQIWNTFYEFTYCCKYTWVPDKNFYLDPIGNGSFTPEETRTGNKVVLQVNMNKMYPNITADFEGKMYTMVAVDPSIPLDKSIYGSRQYPLVHWMAMNGHVDADGYMHFHDELSPWRGPMPPDQGTHTYYFLLMEQEYELTYKDITELASYSGEACRAMRPGLCSFDIPTFASDNGLSLVGASWFNANNTDYVNMTNELPENEETCGKRWPCEQPPIDASGTNIINMAAFIIMMVVAMVLN